MTTVSVATYNMSFVSDAGLNPDGNGSFASEAAFLKSNKSGDPRHFWLNAMENVKKFWNEVSNAGVMGFQELNKIGKGSDALAAFAEEKGLAFAVDEVVINPNMKPALGIMWNPKYFGDYASPHEIKDLDYQPTEVAGVTKQVGRPILMVKTTKGFVLVSLHGPNQEKLAEKEQSDLKNAIREHLDRFAPGVSADKVFIMGDFNDRYDAITSIPLSGGDVTYTGRAPLSCCHNWDSSCSKTRYISLDDQLGRKEVGKCKVENYPPGFKNGTGSELKKWKNKNENPMEARWNTLPRILAGPGPRIEMGEEGNIENYRYYGDKVFGANPVSNIQLFPAGRTGPSRESDHEMVIAEYAIDMAEGGRRRKAKKTRKQRSRSGKAKKSTRKH